jgi:hypothetical protein
MRLSIGYLCPFPIPLESLAEMEGMLEQPEEQLEFGYRLYTVGTEEIEFLPANLTQEAIDTAHFIQSLTNAQKRLLGLSILMVAGDRLLDDRPTEEDQEEWDFDLETSDD